ncbi:sensor domain-containing diguanylate cyclase [Bacillus sp. FJAT-27231]|uniref:sensor domain-containing diguanylate cyclase n=1 Tax=Bacillus sp. FJAT-27231 TaxID=1679168 RepID=UPI000670F05A|nr:diguanylate cyclase [Bacillus sp. FJAT-27231]
MNLNSLGELGNRLLSTIIVSALIIVLLVIASVAGVRFSLSANIKGQQALDSIEGSAIDLFKALVDQETGQRGYSLTNDEAFLEPYYQGIKQFSQNSKELIQKTEKFPALNRKAKKIIERGQYWQNHYGKHLVESTERGEQPSVRLLNEEKETLDDFRNQANSFSKKIEDQRSIVRNTMRTRINLTLTALVVTLIMIIFINLWINYRLLKSVIKPIIELSSCVKSYTEHDFSKETPTYRKKDELFELIRNVGRMRTELSTSIHSLKMKVHYDELTGLYNRRYFNEFIVNEWEAAKKKSENFSLILFDIDHYKDFNDTYGHLAGDECLRRISECLQLYNQEPSHFIARYGGEEFVVLLLQRTEQEALFIAEEIRKAILNLKIPHKTSPISNYVTVSIGVASVVPTGEMMPNDIISAADQALYYSKENGRNQVTQYANSVI